jgi:mRNA-degrading endonuclease RelE of RelBE toxin-antitoxin system
MPYDVFLPEFFKKIIKELKKKYPHVGEDLKTALRVLVNNPELGKTLRGFGDVKKLRVQNSDVERGKSGGYRLIYLVDDSGQRIIPLLLYSKSQKRDISKRELKTLLARLAQDLN